MASIREMFLADEGCVFVRVDMSQDEDRRCKMYTRAKRMVELANKRPHEYDAHRVNAAQLFNVSEDKVDKEQRYIGKRAVHAAQRGMAGDKLSDILLNEASIVMEPKRCQRLIDKYLEVNWEIRDIYFPWVRRQIIDERVLVNRWGRRLPFGYMRLNDDAFRVGYSFFMQSDCADNMNQNGFIPGSWWMQKELRKPLSLQVHDEIVASVPPERAYEYALFVTTMLEQPRDYFGNVLRVPAVVTVGTNWGNGTEMKILPKKKEFDEVVHEILIA